METAIPALRKVKRINQIYQYGKQLGEGSSGRVVIGRHNHFKYLCAIKLISKKKISKSVFFQQQLIYELYTLSVVKHENVLRVFELIHDDNHVAIVTELM